MDNLIKGYCAVEAAVDIRTGSTEWQLEAAVDIRTGSTEWQLEAAVDIRTGSTEWQLEAAVDIRTGSTEWQVRKTTIYVDSEIKCPARSKTLQSLTYGK